MANCHESFRVGLSNVGTLQDCSRNGTLLNKKLLHKVRSVC